MMRTYQESHIHVNVESFLPKDLDNTKRNIKIRPLEGSGFPPEMHVETPRGLCENHAIGTRFKITAEIIDDGNGLGPYLRVPPSFPYEVIW